MLTQEAANTATHMAVLEYFAGERAEMVTAIAIFLAVAASAVWLFVYSRTGFALAFMITTVLAAGLMSAGLTSLMTRDRARSGELGAVLQTKQQPTVMVSEKQRMVVVLSKYRYYRYGAALIAVIAMAGVLLSHRGWVHGAAAGLLLVVVSQVLIDQFSEQRAKAYFERLAGF